MCTVVVRWSAGRPVLIAALRDELVGRDFDDPGEWWAEQPGVIGGRDRTAGGSWCVSDVGAGTTALVLNRPQRRQAAPGAPSRGRLPLLAVRYGRDWPARISCAGMASFAVVLVGPDDLVMWAFDGQDLTLHELSAGTHMVTSGGAEDAKAARHLGAFSASESTSDWRAAITGHAPADDPTALVVRHETADATFATVFGQVFESTPGHLFLTCSRTPWVDGSWQDQHWPPPG